MVVKMQIREGDVQIVERNVLVGVRRTHGVFATHKFGFFKEILINRFYLIHKGSITEKGRKVNRILQILTKY